MSIIYLIECRRDYDSVYKIGYTKNNPNRRLSELQTGNDGELKVLHTFETAHGQRLERILHRFLAHKKTESKKEWFKLDLVDVYNFTAMCEKIEKNLNVINKD